MPSTAAVANDLHRITSLIQKESVEGLDLGTVMRKLRGWKDRQGIEHEGLFEISRQSARTVSRTLINGVANAGRMEMYQQNADVIDGVKWLATLDTRTCLQCAPLDGRIWPPDQMDEVRRPPAHPNCRCVVIPYIDLGEKFEGNRAAEVKDFDKEAEERYNAEQAAKVAAGKKPGKPWEELAYETRKKKRYEAINEYEKEHGKDTAYRQVKSSTTFAEYFETLDAKDQREWLGASRYTAYQTGALRLDDLVNPDDGYVRTVGDLKQTGIVSEKTTKRTEMDTGNSGRSDFAPNDYPEHDERTWNDPLAAEFVERVQTENPEDLKTLEEWTTNADDFNVPIGKNEFTPSQSDKINNLSRIIDGYSVPENMRAYRAISLKTYQRFISRGTVFYEGSEVVINEFSATSMSKQAFRKTVEDFALYGSIRSVEFDFFVPAGTHAIPLSKAPPYDRKTAEPKYEFQKEWLLQRGMRIRVLEMNEFPDGKIRIKALVLDTPSPKEI